MDAVQNYQKTGAIEKQFIERYAPLVKRIAHHLKGRLPQHVLLDDLIQSGMIGLLEALRRFDEKKGASFDTYASIRIRGHMLDEVRRNDWVPRSVYRNSRQVSEAIRQIENRTGRDAKDFEVARELGVSLKDYHHLLKDAIGAYLYGFDDLGVTDDSLPTDCCQKPDEPFREVLRDDFNRHLVAVIDNLPDREKQVLSLYYEQQLNLKEIGEVLGVSESRVSQIHSQTMSRVKARLPQE